MNRKFLSKTKSELALKIILTTIRILIGWHFLYEGLSKLFSPYWSASSYLSESSWILSGFFHRIAENPSVLNIVDFLNIWGLILIGLGLFLGVFTRIAGGAGILLLLLYYIVYPPFIGYLGEYTGEGHYLIINKILIETAVLILFVFLPKNLFWSIDRWILRWVTTRRAAKTSEDTDRIPETDIGRREILKDLVTMPVLGGFIYAAFRKQKWESFEERHLVSEPSRVNAISGASPRGPNFATIKDLKEKVSYGRIGDYRISRLICGGNLISGYAHSRDLIYVSSLVQNYFTDEKVLETMNLCEAAGINTIILRVDKNTLRLIEKYRRRNGNMQWIAQCKITDDEIAPDIDAAYDNDAIGAYIHGGICDDYVKNGKIGILYKALDYIKNKYMLAGIAAHDLNVPIACEKTGLEPDFYMKTLNSANYWTAGPRLITDPEWKPDPKVIVDPEYGADLHDNIWSTTPQQTIEYMKKVEKPWIAYKVLGAGAIHPKEGFKYVFENGADFACVGMFDWQIIENVNILTDLLAGDLSRERSWKAW